MNFYTSLPKLPTKLTWCLHISQGALKRSADGIQNQSVCSSGGLIACFFITKFESQILTGRVKTFVQTSYLVASRILKTLLISSFRSRSNPNPASKFLHLGISPAEISAYEFKTERAPLFIWARKRFKSTACRTYEQMLANLNQMILWCYLVILIHHHSPGNRRHRALISSFLLVYLVMKIFSRISRFTLAESTAYKASS